VPDVAVPDVVSASGETTSEMIRRRWDEVVANFASPVVRALVGPNAQVLDVDAGVLRLGFESPGLAKNLERPDRRATIESAVYETLGLRVRVEPVVGHSAAHPRESAPRSHGTNDAGGDEEPAPPKPFSGPILGAKTDQPTAPDAPQAPMVADPPVGPEPDADEIDDIDDLLDEAFSPPHDDSAMQIADSLPSQAQTGVSLVLAVLGGTIIEELLDEERAGPQ
jgi:DNA polymerase-3 subunit gamma/tau